MFHQPEKSNHFVHRFLIVTMIVLALLTLSGCILPMSGAMKEGATGNVDVLQTAGGGNGNRQMYMMKGPKIIPAAGLPTTTPDVAGLFQRREDQSLFIGTGEVEMRVTIPEKGGEPVAKATSNGPTVEVVVNRNTQIYKDTSEISMEARRDGLEVQQTVELLDSLDQLLEEISTTDTLSVWGRKSGDRVIAEVIIYRPFDMPALPPQ